MRYSLWSHDVLVGHTDLDVRCVQDRLRQGFIEPTEGGRSVLIDATAVAAVCARRRSRGVLLPADDEYLAEFGRACERREALDLVLRDEGGTIFECEYMRVYEVQDSVAEMGLSDEPYDPVRDDDDDDDDLDADILAELEEQMGELNGSFSSESTWEPEDDRWNTMEYFLQVVLSM